MSEPDIPGFDPDEDYGLAVARPELKKPSMYKVIMLNDDYTPMEFVIHVLELFFNMDQEKATQIMLTVHTKGAAVCGVYPKDIAETKAEHVVEYAKENQHPLMCHPDLFIPPMKPLKPSRFAILLSFKFWFSSFCKGFETLGPILRKI